MKLGNLGRQEALDLIARHSGDRDEITAELFLQRGRSRGRLDTRGASAV
ncbi:hypothetical protein X743_14895 [Mesorhizobium sp. LNHC252B00]|nr:hypothetical protein X743_14895 [Mesorhizobium sp. LNHC252B00]